MTGTLLFQHPLFMNGGPFRVAQSNDLIRYQDPVYMQISTRSENSQIEYVIRGWSIGYGL